MSSPQIASPIMFNFFDLPDDIIRFIFAEWVNVDLTIRNLDIALCSHKIRSRVLQLFVCADLLTTESSFSSLFKSIHLWDGFYEWSLLRGLRFRKVVLPSSFEEVTGTVFPKLIQSGCNQAVENLVMGEMTRWLRGSFFPDAIDHLPNLRELDVAVKSGHLQFKLPPTCSLLKLSISMNFLLTLPVSEIESALPHLQELCLFNISSCKIAIAYIEQLPCLHTLSLGESTSCEPRSVTADVPDSATWSGLRQLPQLRTFSVTAHSHASSLGNIYKNGFVSYILDRACNLQTVNLFNGWLAIPVLEMLFCAVLHRLHSVCLKDDMDMTKLSIGTMPGCTIGFNLPVGFGASSSSPDRTIAFSQLRDALIDACANQHHIQSLQLHWNEHDAMPQSTWENLARLQSRSTVMALSEHHKYCSWEWKYLIAMKNVDKLCMTVQNYSPDCLLSLQSAYTQHPSLPSSSVRDLHWVFNNIKEHVADYMIFVPTMFANVRTLTFTNLALSDSLFMYLMLHLRHLLRFSLCSHGNRTLTLKGISCEQWQLITAYSPCRVWTFSGLFALSLESVQRMIESLGPRLRRLTIRGGDRRWGQTEEAKCYLRSKSEVFDVSTWV